MYKNKGKVMVKGLKRMVLGVAIAIILAAAVYGFIVIPKESGYLAVLDFFAAFSAVAVAIRLAYVLGSMEDAQ